MEQLRRRAPAQSQERPDFELGGGSASPGSGAGSDTVQFVWGSTIHDLDLADMSVGEVHAMLGGAYNLAPDAVATVNGEEANSSTRLSRGDTLEFVRAAGEKGGE